VFNQLGNLVHEEAIQQAGTLINLEHLTDGVYLLHLSSASLLSNTEKLIIRH
jgi:hypothetical protein